MNLHIRRSTITQSTFWHGNCVLYQLRIVALFETNEVAIIAANRWWGHDLYRSQHLLDCADRYAEIHSEPLRPPDPDRVMQLGIIEQWAWKQARLAVASHRISTAHRITIGDLANGVHLDGDLDSITTTEAMLTEACKILDAKLNAARAFHGGADIRRIGATTQPLPQRQPRRIA
jgi:hypothetical protein